MELATDALAAMSSGTLKKSDDTPLTDGFQRQGSFRKVLPSVPSGDSQLSMSAKMIDRPAMLARSHQKAFMQYQQEYSIISEYNMLRKQQIPGIYVIPSAQNSLLWFGVLFVRQGLYQGGIFRFCIYIPEAFPDGGCPRVLFQSRVFHPMINPNTGEMDVKSGFQEWRKNVNHIYQVVQFIRRAFYKIETKTPLNQEAADLYEKNPDMFRDSVRSVVKISQEQVYDPSPVDDVHYISFEPFDNEIHGPIREALFMAQDQEDDFTSIGLSWVQPGSLQTFSKPTS